MIRNRNRANILGCYIDVIDSKTSIEKIKKFIAKGKPAHVITLNAEIAYMAQEDQALKTIINAADLVTPDGIGIVWAARRLGWAMEERVTGIDMVYNICPEAEEHGWRLYFLGAEPGVAKQAAEKLLIEYPKLQIVGIRDGYFKENEIDVVCADIKATKPHILLVALGAPKQELFIKQYKDKLEVPVCIGIGGSFDVIAGIKKRAPDLAVKYNMEWLYRLISEPSRIKRQIVLPKFVYAVLTKGEKKKL
ncbi:MAG TPA: WecB/TagA/CpsF family glycosyltransferase [Syntrophomonadaceae bacterium]|nr:WecB/TagA/CpsF family glycosyltransferase [Syntrophomonadaceae bacterium]